VSSLWPASISYTFYLLGAFFHPISLVQVEEVQVVLSLISGWVPLTKRPAGHYDAHATVSMLCNFSSQVVLPQRRR